MEPPAGPTPEIEHEIRCTVHWFQSWSDMQKGDFLKDLLDKAIPNHVDTLFDAMQLMGVQDKPMTLFKCQMKLFSGWFEGWTDRDRNDLMQRLEEVDPSFVSRFNEELKKAGVNR